MKNAFSISMKVVAAFTILSFFTSGCTLIEDILRALGRYCETADWTVTTTLEAPRGGLCTTTSCSLRQAVESSNACPGTQTIHVPAGTYILTLAGASEDNNRTGDLDITDSVNITGTGRPVIDGNHIDRVFDVMGGATADITDLTIQNGQADEGGGIRSRGVLRLHGVSVLNNQASGTVAYGGGILSLGEALSINSSQVMDNSAVNGGGIAVARIDAATPATFELFNTTVDENTASLYGGGLWLSVRVNASLSSFEVNRNTASGTGDGGGIQNEGGTLHLDQGTLEGNRANGGSALETEAGGELTATGIVVRDNSTGLAGCTLALAGRVSITHSAVVDNRSDDGTCGGINVFGTVSFDNTTVSGNQGVGINIGGSGDTPGSAQIEYSTIADNSSYGITTIEGAAALVHNSILAGNAGVNCAGRGTITSLGYNIDSGDFCGFGGPGDLANTDPLLLPLALDGGTYIHALNPASPALNSADPAACGGTDQRGVARPQGLRCDRGAYELAVGGAVSPVTPTFTPTPGLTGTPTSTPTPSATTVTATPTAILIPGGSSGTIFGGLSFSTDHFYSGGAGCGPLDEKFQIGVSGTDQVASVVLFFHLTDKAGTGSTPWNNGVAMQSLSGGKYEYDLPSNTIPAFNSYPEAWLVYQFVATGPDGKVLLRSPAYSDVTLSMCGKK